ERWNGLHEEISQFMYNVGSWTLEDGQLHGHGAGLAETFTGSSRWKDVEVETQFTPINGAAHNLEFRVQGAARCYAAGIAENGKVKLYKKYIDYKTVAEAELSWEYGKPCTIKVVAVGKDITVSVNGAEVLKWADEEKPYLYGSVGVSTMKLGHCAWDYIKVKEL
ncbi:MAG: ADP-ribosylglycohydrolase family protein, partial [Oscillospiraceae bacterium]|nr:ADP-ribosylglycohydrolase family protein [Oscillospiraceae bacterium]